MTYTSAAQEQEYEYSMHILSHSIKVYMDFFFHN